MFRSPLFDAALEVLGKVIQLDEARAGIVLSESPAKRGLRQADKRGRMKRPLEKCRVAEDLEVARRSRIALQPAASPRKENEWEIRPFLLRTDP